MKTFKQFYISEELSSSEELHEALKLVEQIDSKISGINGKTELKNDNKKEYKLHKLFQTKIE